MHVLRLLGAGSFAVILTAAAPARADEDAVLDTARELFQKGVKAYEQKKWDQCRAAFLAAFAIKRHQQIAGNLAECELQVGAYRDAAEHAWFFLHALRPDAPAERRTAGETVLANSQRRIGTITLSADADGAEVVVDGHPVGRTPLQAPLFVEPGRHIIEVLHGTRGNARETVELAAGQARELAIVVGKNEGGPPPPVVPPERRAIWPAAVGGGAAGVLLVGGIAFTVVSNGQSRDADAQRAAILGGGGQCVKPPSAFGGGCADIKSKLNSLDTTANAARGMYAAAGVLAIGALTYALFPGPKPPKFSAVWVVPLVGSSGGGAAIGGAW
jgi:hypothetical protein